MSKISHDYSRMNWSEYQLKKVQTFPGENFCSGVNWSEFSRITAGISDKVT